uniref:ATP synthase complex subunit 8 n=1 Tax=Neolucanus maximus TaxID=618182 RepID=A0A346TLP6_9SCAR|nr:ATP synthase F0 subunit 8 [Neolucanus maximus]AXU40286.1 ATP synthase F0 subunit 8 [Neolucanus maximus]
MPQMSPMNWTTLTIMFILVFIMFNTTNFFSMKYNPSKLEIKKITKSSTWKW